MNVVVFLMAKKEGDGIESWYRQIDLIAHSLSPYYLVTSGHVPPYACFLTHKIE